MKSETPLIELQEISKSYPTHKKSGRAFWSALLGNRTAEGERKVLSNINLSISRGETIGIIGRNGAGKSTLLQIITGVLPATTGQKRINATIAAMLEAERIARDSSVKRYSNVEDALRVLKE